MAGASGKLVGGEVTCDNSKMTMISTFGKQMKLGAGQQVHTKVTRYENFVDGGQKLVISNTKRTTNAREFDTSGPKCFCMKYVEGYAENLLLGLRICHFCSDQADIQTISPTHELILLTKFHENRVKTEDFLVIAKFWHSSKFSAYLFIASFTRNKNLI